MRFAWNSWVLGILNPLGSIVSYMRYKYGRLRLESLMHRGLKIGKNVYIENGFEFDPVYPFLIQIGDNCRIAKGVKILAHDATIFRELGVNRLAPVRILEGCFIGERAIILPGCTIGPRAMIAAGSMVNRDIGEGKVAAGNPARPYTEFNVMIDKYREIVPNAKVFFKKDIENGRVASRDIADYLNHNPVAFVQGVPQNDPCYVNANIHEIRDAAIRSFDELMNNKYD
jgi:acetyltransferase-like isoleucine patch superfamily enzyme